jgi:hypothetical protein
MIYTPQLELTILSAISDGRIDASVLPSTLMPKVLKLIDGKADITKFSLEEKMIIASALSISSYVYTISSDKNIGVRVVKDLLPALGNQFQHRQLNAGKRLLNNDSVVISDKDAPRHLEAAYFILNKKSIMNDISDYDNIKKSKFAKSASRIIETDNSLDRMIKMISSFKLSEPKILIEGKFNQNQYILLLKLWSENSVMQSDMMKILQGSPKKKYADVSALENRGLINALKIKNNKSTTLVLTGNGRSLLSNLITKFL